MEDFWENIYTYATSWVKEAGEMIKDSFSKELLIETKSNPNDLVTNMDKDVETFLYEKIQETFPTHRIVGEEGHGTDVTSAEGVLWVIDPIDGTMNFVHQQRNFAISIGIFENGVGKIGLIYDVMHDELYHTIRGNGAYMNDIKLPMLTESPVKEAILSLNATWVTDNHRIDPAVLSPLVKDVRGTRSYGSAALELAYIAAGRLDGYITMRLAPWDFAGGLVLIEEVGGVVTNVYGEELNILEKNSVFAGEKAFHKEVLQTYINKKR
ncbi:inositol monophosphatase family protein [Priestia endophytica]|jgi:myo-inositol-1(or 4)-monophosphatase|uniref:inositol-phosphate phosphatase n=1 Tax=Priestia endophytica DSM 13796 TaxID=1121089 RepID=A0A1I5XX88_9BACI|nr:inositol monophosphatase family protein [Priestia endophytica]KYG31441.1 inositol monophosphatase [Priestia endophytica]RAS81490.1 inositol monophosphatase [Priestia endophytica]SFQ36327.1 myo-inositol-1(or 4)-monophosphatase [Priestia endophytica DSM 13796]